MPTTPASAGVHMVEKMHQNARLAEWYAEHGKTPGLRQPAPRRAAATLRWAARPLTIPPTGNLVQIRKLTKSPSAPVT